jgi:hypothetical protein
MNSILRHSNVKAEVKQHSNRKQILQASQRNQNSKMKTYSTVKRFNLLTKSQACP